jgi:hypothetical protein
MLRRVALVRTDVSEEPVASFIRVTRIGELGTTLAYLATDASYEEIQRRYIPEDNAQRIHNCVIDLDTVCKPQGHELEFPWVRGTLFNFLNPSSRRTLVLESIQPLTERGPKILMEVKGGRSGRVTWPPHVSRLSTKSEPRLLATVRISAFILLILSTWYDYQTAVNMKWVPVENNRECFPSLK